MTWIKSLVVSIFCAGSILKNIIVMATILVACDKEKTHDYDSGNLQEEHSLCSEQVLEEGTLFRATAFDECFEGNEQYAACETCGYYTDVGMSQGAYDCITCPAGYEIDVVFSDCTGHCVIEGTASRPIQQSGCEPVSDCVLE